MEIPIGFELGKDNIYRFKSPIGEVVVAILVNQVCLNSKLLIRSIEKHYGAICTIPTHISPQSVIY
jgi:hypothetical protein